MPPSKSIAVAKKNQKSRKAQLKRARMARNATCEASTPSTPPSVTADSSSNFPPSPPPSTPPPSTSKRKLDYFNQDRIEESAETCYYAFVNLFLLNDLFKNLLCPSCKTASVVFVFKEENYLGSAVNLSVTCSRCDGLQNKCVTSSKISPHSYDVNRRMTLAFNSLGLGHSGLALFCEVMGMRHISKSSYREHKESLLCAADRARDNLLSDSHRVVRQAYLDGNLATPDEDGVLDVTVSYDGSWQKRGHTSNHGIGCVIDSVTGLVLDYEAVTRYCQTCVVVGGKLKSDTAAYDRWWEQHKDECDANHHGSSGAMEVAVAKILWPRSMSHKFRYTTMIGDGDCKTHNELQSLAPYGDQHPVRKEECINHFSKRLGTALRKVVATEKVRGVTLGGVRQGSLTQNKMALMQKYFTRAILQNPGSMEGMRKSIWAIYNHAISTDSSPHHDFCPTGPDSWCHHQKALALNLPLPPHKSSILLNSKVAEAIRGTFERLTTDELLSRCLQGKTQNPNESVHAVIWNFCPKTRFVGIKRLRIGLYLGVTHFNCGSLSLQQLMKESNLTISSRSLDLGTARDRANIYFSTRAATLNAKERREQRRIAQNRVQAEMETAEGGPMYATGLF